MLSNGSSPQGIAARAEHWLGTMLSKGVAADVVAYTAVISAHASQGNVEGATHWLAEMAQNGVEANVVTYNAVIGACAKIGDAKTVLELIEAGRVECHKLCGVGETISYAEGAPGPMDTGPEHGRRGYDFVAECRHWHQIRCRT